jgi:glycerol-3-phosphate acyltransferase PlsY
MLIVALLVPLAWLLGTFPSAPLVARAHGRDITQEGSGNPGATNVARVLGWKAGAIVLAADFAKGAIAAGVGLIIAGHSGALVLGTAAILGHIFPLYRKGGKGVAVGAGVLTVIYPLLVLGGAVVWVVIARVMHKASLASVVCAVLFPIAVFATDSYEHIWEVVLLGVLAALVVVRHAANIRRMIRHEEIGMGKES